jgi:SAM-dependent methyltransferase
MLTKLFSKFKRDPYGFIKRALYKKIIDPIKYGEGGDYDAHRYWSDRFSKHGFVTLKGVGDEGLAEEENKRMYAEAADLFTCLCQKEGVDFETTSVLELGCGNGFWTRHLHNLGVKRYVGVDITDIFFPKLRKLFPNYHFIRKDITSDKIDGQFDLIVMIDVIEHILTEAKLSSAVENIKNCLSEKGISMLAGIGYVNKKYSFYNRVWSLDDIKPKFSGHVLSELIPFRNNYILVIKKTTKTK